MDDSTKRRRIIEDEEDDEGYAVPVESSQVEDEAIEAEEAEDAGYVSNPDEYIENGNISDEEGEDLEENWLDDYAPAPELDYYDPELLADDNEDIQESYEDQVRNRLAAEAAIEERERRRRLRDNLDNQLERVNKQEQEELYDLMREENEDDFLFDDDEEEDEEKMRNRMLELMEGEAMREEAIDEETLNLERFEGSLKDWISEERTRREIYKRLKKFLLTYYDGIDKINEWLKENEIQNNSKEPITLPSHLKVKPPLYPQKIRHMCSRNSSSLEVSYPHLAIAQPLLAVWLTDCPREIINIFDLVVKEVVMTQFPHYARITSKISVRIRDLPLSDSPRHLRLSHLNTLVKVRGIITKRTQVYPYLVSRVYQCVSCHYLISDPSTSTVNFTSSAAASFSSTATSTPVVSSQIFHPTNCPRCNEKNPRLHESSQYINYQKLTLQESPSMISPGQVPRSKEIIVYGDLIDRVRPGEEVFVTGIYLTISSNNIKRNNNNFWPIYNTNIEANYIEKYNKKNSYSDNVNIFSSAAGQSSANSSSTLDSNDLKISEEDKKKIFLLSKDPNILERIIKSIAPSIYGHRHVKTSIALSLFGGCHKTNKKKRNVGDSSGSNIQEGTHRIRGDINILLLGDPGTAKSQLLKYCEKISPRSIFTTGKGASAVGLTAGVHRDGITGEWVLEGGALVLADQGVCLIDEFDKMNEQDRTSIHEAMEQQTISVSKAGIVTSLQARCSVIAAANPIGGRYDSSYSFAENVELTDPILQRFDVLCVLQDIVDPIQDERLAGFVVNSHIRSHPQFNYYKDKKNESKNGNAMEIDEDNQEDDEFNFLNECYDDTPNIDPISQDLLRLYISYARTSIRPILTEIDIEKISNFYADLRSHSALTGGIPIAIRHIESIIRLSEASARLHLRDIVIKDDVDLGIKIILESFLISQKISVRNYIKKVFYKFIINKNDENYILLKQLKNLFLNYEKMKNILSNSSSDSTLTENYIEIPIIEFENRVKKMQIYDLDSFYNSQVFKNHKFQIDHKKEVIRKFYL